MSEPASSSSSSLPPNARLTAPSGRRYSDAFKQDALRLITGLPHGWWARRVERGQFMQAS